VEVLQVTPNANAAIHAANEFNSPPAAGKQFFMVEVQTTYTGNGTDASQTVIAGLTFKALGPSNVAYDFSDNCGVIPNELESSKDVFKGGTVTGNICWAVTPADANALLMDVEPGLSVNSSPVFFALK